MYRLVKVLVKVESKKKGIRKDSLLAYDSANAFCFACLSENASNKMHTGTITQLPMLPGAVPLVTIGFIWPMTIRIAYSTIISTYIAEISDLYLM